MKYNRGKKKKQKTNSPRAHSVNVVIALYSIVEKQHNDCKVLCREHRETKKKSLFYPTQST